MIDMSEPESGSEPSLRILFTEAQKLESTLNSLASSSSTEYQDIVTSAIGKYTSAKNLARSLSLFSPNESLDDIASSDLQYLSLDYHLANLIQKSSASTQDRKSILLTSQSAYDDFLHLLLQYSILPAADRNTLSRFSEDKANFTVVAVTDPAKRRDAKIARLRDEKALKSKLETLRQDPAALDADDEALRDLRLAELQLHVLDSFQALDFIAQELRILAMAPASAPPPDPRQLADDHRVRTTGQDSGAGYSDRLDENVRTTLLNGRGGPILDSRGRPMQPFVLMDRRQELRGGVFRQGHRLPTMSIDEYLEEERRRGGIIEGGGEPPVVEPDEDDLEKADAETIKQRAWDEYVEENPRGSGNTINRG